MATSTATFTPSPTATPGRARIGNNRGEIAVGGSQIWTYQGQAGETLTITVLADHPGSGTDPEEWVAKGLFDSLLRVCSPDGTLLAENDDINSTSLPVGSVADTDSQISDLSLPIDGVYRLEIRSAYGGVTSGSYTLVIESSRSLGASPSPTATSTSAPRP